MKKWFLFLNIGSKVRPIAIVAPRPREPPKPVTITESESREADVAALDLFASRLRDIREFMANNRQTRETSNDFSASNTNTFADSAAASHTNVTGHEDTLEIQPVNLTASTATQQSNLAPEQSVQVQPSFHQHQPRPQMNTNQSRHGTEDPTLGHSNTPENTRQSRHGTTENLVSEISIFRAPRVVEGFEHMEALVAAYRDTIIEDPDTAADFAALQRIVIILREVIDRSNTARQ